MNKGKSDTTITKKLGRIPKGWEISKLGWVIDKIIGGGTPSKTNPNYWDGSIPWSTVKDLSKFKIDSTQQNITAKGLENSSANLIPANTIITATRMLLGVAVRYTIDVSINQDLKALITNEKIDDSFLLKWFECYKERIDYLGNGSTVKGISLDAFKAIKLKLPPLPEQQKIAQILSTWDKAIALQDQLIKEKQALKKGLMQQLLTGKKRFAGFEAEWEEVRLSEVFNLSSGKTKPKNFSEHPLDEFAIPVYGGNGISGYTNEVFFNGPVILIGRVGEYCGIIHFVRESIWITDNCMYTKEFNPKNDILFFAFLLEYIQLDRLRNKGGQPLVSQKPILNLKVKKPNLLEQQKIAAVLSSFDAEIENRINYKNSLIEQKQGLMQQLLSGEKRVKI